MSCLLPQLYLRVCTYRCYDVVCKLMREVSVTIMLMYDYVYVCLFLSTYKIGYVVVSHSTKESKKKVCNGTRLLITRLDNMIIEAEIVTKNYVKNEFLFVE